MLPNRPPGRYSTPRPWQPLSDDELVALWPFFVHKGSGRPIFDIRARLDAIFWVACHNGRWRDLPPHMGPWDTAARQFRRWVHKGVWEELLGAVAARGAPPALRGLEHWVCRAFHRALRILGMRALRLVRRLGLLSALKGPAEWYPDWDLSVALLPGVLRAVQRQIASRGAPLKTLLAGCKSFHALCGGRRWIPSWAAPP
jgi:transposase